MLQTSEYGCLGTVAYKSRIIAASETYIRATTRAITMIYICQICHAPHPSALETTTSTQYMDHNYEELQFIHTFPLTNPSIMLTKSHLQSPPVYLQRSLSILKKTYIKSESGAIYLWLLRIQDKLMNFRKAKNFIF